MKLVDGIDKNLADFENLLEFAEINELLKKFVMVRVFTFPLFLTAFYLNKSITL
jgi:hypothetical protein